MAESSSLTTSIISIQCSLCYQEYSADEEKRVPRVLSCGHTFCTECLQRWSGKEEICEEASILVAESSIDEGQDLECPNCKRADKIASVDVLDLPKNFALLDCTPTSPSGSGGWTKYVCQDHKKTKDIYCCSDGELICSYCVVFGSHKNHECLTVDEACLPVREELKVGEDSLTGDTARVTDAYQEVEGLIAQIQREEVECKKTLDDVVSCLCRELKKFKDVKKMEVTRWCEEQVEILSSQRDALENAKTRCEQTLASCQKLVKASSVVILTEHKMVMDAINCLCSQVDTQPLRPLIQPTIQCTAPPTTDLLAGMLCKIKVSLCGEEEKSEEARENGEDSSMHPSEPGRIEWGEIEESREREELGEMPMATSKMAVCAISHGNLSRQPLRWPFEKSQNLTPSVNQEPQFPQDAEPEFPQEAELEAISIGCAASPEPTRFAASEPTCFVCEASDSDEGQEF